MTHPQAPGEPPSLTSIANKLPVLEEQVKTAVSELQADRAERDEFEGLVRNAIKIAAGVIAVVLLAALASAYGVWNIIDGRSVSRDSQRQIIDCTQPAGQCYKDTAAREAEQSREISRRVAETQADLIACSYRAERDYPTCRDVALQHLADR